ncbi:hypothetical protein HK101_010399 [Irineochytrium annulatum]|nr:hypothetical protein HK101_010399 [Irineochytrium annulatum]
MPSNVLVFGATGTVGSYAAKSAASRGANVTLAVRDLKKPVDADISHFKKVQADLTDPASVEKAVRDSQATAAFIYCIHGSDMKDVAEALKRGGVNHIVLLSSYFVPVDLDSATEKSHIPYVHALVERTILKIDGIKLTSVRPGVFTTNTVHQWKYQLRAGKVSFSHADCPVAYIAVNDIGDVSGAILAAPAPAARHTVVDLVGPERITFRDAALLVAKEAGFPNVEVVSLTEEEHLAATAAFIPKEILESIFEYHRKVEQGALEDVKLSENVMKYAGRPATKFVDWVRANKALYHA